METKQLKRLPVGIQTFDKLIQGGYLYIDKTEYIHKMVNASNYIFLSRPRRFGKSLLVSTLQCYFEGKKELFKGLAMEQLEKEWTQYPVLRFDMSQGRECNHSDDLKQLLSSQLSHFENIYCNGTTTEDDLLHIRLSSLIKAAYDITGQRVVVLIDDYDAALLKVLHDKKEYEARYEIILDFFSPLKACDPYLEFLFLTGTTKYVSPMLLGTLNNLSHISMLPEFAAICGITVEEMQTQMADYIDVFAEAEEVSHEEAVERLKKQYDGYHFTWPSPDIFNPFSLLNAMQDRRLDSYWFASSTPTYLIEMLRKFDVLLSDISEMEAVSEEFDAPTEGMSTIIPLLYQSGYITIKDYHKNFNYYTLSIPNKEVRIGLLRSFVPSYVQTSTLVVNNTARRMAQYIVDDDVDSALSLLQKFLQTVPYCDNASSEGHYQQMLYIILSLLAQYEDIDVEVRTPTGRVDMVMRTDKALYLFELKMNKSAATAMKQIDLKDYPARFAQCGLPIVKVGINFDDEKRTIGDWEIVPTL